MLLDSRSSRKLIFSQRTCQEITKMRDGDKHEGFIVQQFQLLCARLQVAKLYKSFAMIHITFRNFRFNPLQPSCTFIRSMGYLLNLITFQAPYNCCQVINFLGAREQHCRTN